MERPRLEFLVGALLTCAGCPMAGADDEAAACIDPLLARENSAAGEVLTAAACDEDGETIDPTGAPAPVGFTPGSSMLVALPDTQMYSRNFPGLFDSQTAWIARNAEALDIRHVFHLGDIVDGNSERQWQRARDSMSLLDGVVPYALAPGNHDYGAWAADPPRNTTLNDWFSFDEAAQVPTFGGAHETGRLENTYYLFEAGGHAWIALALEWGPRDEVVTWANQVMEAHPDRLGILVTHAYLNHNDRRYDHTDTEHPQDYNPHHYPTPGSINDGEELWQKLVRHHRFVMTLSGHVLDDGTGYLASTTDLGNTCHQMLSNYQFRQLGGEGYLRLLELLPDGRTIVVRTYSPVYDRFLTETDQELTIQLDGAHDEVPARRHRSR